MNAKRVFESLGKEIISGTGESVMRRKPACRLSRRHVSLYSPKTPKLTYLHWMRREEKEAKGGNFTCRCRPW
jgi:hypothetical protein